MAGIRIRSECAGQGACGKCAVEIRRGTPHFLPSRFDLEENRRLACRTEVAEENLEVFVPEESREVSSEVEISRVASERPFPGGTSLIRKTRIEVPEPSLENNLADAERLKRSLSKSHAGEYRIPLSVLHDLPVRLRDAGWNPELVLGCSPGGWEVIEAGTRAEGPSVVAVDIGTTMLKATLLTPDGRWTASCANTQGVYGPDVITRIIYCEEHAGGLEKMQELAAQEINRLIAALVEQAGTRVEQIRGVVISGNTTMMHFLLGLRPEWIRQEPYVGCTNLPDPIPSRELGIDVHPRASVYPLPSAASYVGADITAGVLATGLHEARRPSVLIDLGTNGEIVVGSREFLLCCSASAGPAFEGGGSASGTWARPGAICDVWDENNELRWRTIADRAPLGICGTGYIDLIATLLRMGILDKTGDLVEDASPRIRHGRAGPEFLLMEGDDSATGRDIVITQADINNLVRAKGAIYAAGSILLENLGMEWSDMEKIMLAGGFGESIDIENAVTIGLLPDVERSKIKFVGNTSLAGAVRAAEECEAYWHMRDIATSMTYFELSTNAAYMDEFVSACFLPHTDTEMFPSVETLASTES
jgi:uncharacterized 2Fe-2S/4Fe-4S cluster protein (DUF4445 family)